MFECPVGLPLLLIALSCHGNVASPVSRTLSPPLNPWPEPSPTQQPQCRSNENEDDGLILGRVPLETRGQDILLLFPSAKAVSKAELTVAVVARLLGCAGFSMARGLLSNGWCVEGDNCAVPETCALAKGCRGGGEGDGEGGEEGQEEKEEIRRAPHFV